MFINIRKPNIGIYESLNKMKYSMNLPFVYLKFLLARMYKCKSRLTHGGKEESSYQFLMSRESLYIYINMYIRTHICIHTYVCLRVRLSILVIKKIK